MSTPSKNCWQFSNIYINSGRYCSCPYSNCSLWFTLQNTEHSIESHPCWQWSTLCQQTTLISGMTKIWHLVKKMRKTFVSVSTCDEEPAYRKWQLFWGIRSQLGGREKMRPMVVSVLWGHEFSSMLQGCQLGNGRASGLQNTYSNHLKGSLSGDPDQPGVSP